MVSGLSFAADSIRRISTSFWRILSFSFFSLRSWLEDWIMATYLLRSFFTSPQRWTSRREEQEGGGKRIEGDRKDQGRTKKEASEGG